jgi:hypothetical protein
MAMRAPLPGHAGFDLTFDNQGFNGIVGTFTVLEAVYDLTTPQPTVVSFAADFDVQADAAHVTGHVYYNYYMTGGIEQPRGGGFLHFSKVVHVRVILRR